MMLGSEFKNFLDVIQKHMNEIPDRLIFTFLDKKANELKNCSLSMLHEKATIIAGFLMGKAKPGDRALLMYSTEPEFIYAFLGCLYAGVIAVPVCPPKPGDGDKKLKHIIADASPVISLTSSSLFSGLKATYQGPVLVNTEDIKDSWKDNNTLFSPEPRDIAFLQYTSGSTSKPKGVMISHGNLIANEEMIKQYANASQRTVGAGWAPIYHDMGLVVNILQPLYIGHPCILMSPLTFLRDPMSWLRVISKYKVTASGGPNFGYDLCIQRATKDVIEKLDLSSWDIAFCGGEPHRAGTLDLFSKIFEPCGFRKETFYPSYGLAETCVFVVGGRKEDPLVEITVKKDAFNDNRVVMSDDILEDRKTLVGSGFNQGGQRIEIVDPEERIVLGENNIGEIWVQSPCVARGYWKNSRQTEAVFNAYLKNGQGPFLRTGDLGFVNKKEIFIAGRLKDVIIVNGRNHYPQDIELTAENSAEGIRSGRIAAFQVPADDEEKLCIIAEYTGNKEITSDVIDDIRYAVSRDHQLKVHIIGLVKRKQIPITTSVKIRRRATRKAYLENRFDIIALSDISTQSHNERISKDEHDPLENTVLSPEKGHLAERIREIVAERLHLDPAEIDSTAPLGRYGLSSQDAVALIVEFEILTGESFSPTIIFEYPTIVALVGFLSEKLDSKTRQTINRKLSSDDIAVIGLSCRFPGSPDTDIFWKNLVDEMDLVTSVPEDRKEITHRGHTPADSAAASHDRGGFIDGIGNFDAGFFGISSVEATSMDPQHRIFLETAWRAIEDAGYAPSSLSGKDVGVFAGIMTSDYNALAVENNAAINAYSASGLIHSMLSNRLSYILNLHGPSETINTACSSSLVAVHRAVRAICNHECDQAIVGGVNTLLSSTSHNTAISAGVLSKDGKCKAFDASADGYVRSEGVGVIILKPVKKAVEDNDHIYAVIKGSAVNHGGRSLSLTAPNENAQASLIVNAVEKAGVSPDTLTYIEAHGTGTSLGDPIEVNGLKKAFGSMQNGQKTYCGIGSVKSNIGHLEAAAGIASLIKTVLALKYKKIPASINFKQLNPYICLKDSPFYIVENTRVWEHLSGTDGHPIPLRAGVSSFGYGGANAHVVVEEYSCPERKSTETAEPHAIVLSAKTACSLDRYVHAFNDFLNNKDGRYCNEELRLSDIAVTLQTGRDHFSERMAFIANSLDELKTILKNIVSGKIDDNKILKGHSVRRQSGQSEKIRPLMERKDLPLLVRQWVEGVEIDWRALHTIKNRKRVSLPTYRFEKTYYWIGEGKTKKVVIPQSGEKHIKPLPVTFDKALEWLKITASEYTGIQPHYEIDTKISFGDYGLDSIALIDILNRINNEFHIELSDTAIQDCPNIDSLANFMVYGKKYELPDLEKEAILDKTLLPVNIREQYTLKDNIPARHIFLTGATGFLGIFLLNELVNKTDAEIYCLVRAEDSREGVRRLNDAMEKFQITDCCIDNRVTVLPGDLTEARFGIDKERYEQLSQTIDTVYHCGAIVDWMKSYAALKKVNVSGTIEAIKFAGYNRIKHFHYISSLAVLPLTDDKYQWFETDISKSDNLTNGYAQSKWVAESLCTAAREKGLPVNIYRFDFVAGTEKTGAMKETDFIVRFIKGCIQSGCVPVEESNLDIVSVDHLAKTILDISQLIENKTYHMINRRPFTTSDFVSLIRQFGYKLEKISFESWKKLIEHSPTNALYPLYPFLKKYTGEQLGYYHKLSVDNTHTLKALYQVDPDLVAASPSAEDIMQQVIVFFQKQGYLPVGCHEKVLKRQKTYWQKQLSGAPMRLDLPKEKWVKQDRTSQPVSEFFSVDGSLFENIEELASRTETIIPEILLTAFKIFLLRYCRETDIAVAVPVAYPVSMDSDQKRAHITKIPIIRTQLTENASFRSVLFDVKQTVSEAYAHSDLPSDEICRMIYAGTDLDVKPTYDCIFTYKDTPDSPVAISEKLNISPFSEDNISIKFDGITLSFDKSGKSLKGSIAYAPDQFSKDMIMQMIRHFNVLLRQVINNPDVNVFKFPIMEKEELDQILYEWNDTRADYPSDKCIHDIISMQAKRTPDAIAISFEGKQMTYQELDEQSSQLGGYLQKHSVGPGNVVGLCMERSFNLMIGILGTLKSGAAYVPLDPDYPETRLKFMIEDSGVKLILTQSKNRNNLPEIEGMSVLCLDKNSDEIFREKYSIRETNNNASNLAYIIYTSGSTGNPKGVRIFHRSVVNLLYATDHYLQLNEDDVFLAMTSLCFDPSIVELFAPLFSGASIELLPVGIEKNGELLKNFLDHNTISLMFATPTTWQMLKMVQWQGNASMTLISGGEALPEDLAQTLMNWGKVVYNLYGPTEITVCCTLNELKPKEPVTIGRPFSNTQMYILDNYQNPLPIGAKGELYIGGDCLAEGYHNLAELTESSFIQNPYGNGIERIYRTGDFVRFLPDGNVDYLGRLDNQIKINGYRVELEEIRSIVDQDDQTEKCEIILREDKKNNKRIVVYIIPKNDTKYINVAKIHETIKEKLPTFMIPAAYIVMEKFPLTPSGKVDKNSFPAPRDCKSVNNYTPPSTTLEFKLAEIWQKVLTIEKIGVHDNFLEIGGNSITSIKLLDEIRDKMGIDLRIQHFYENLTIAELSETIDKIHHNNYQGVGIQDTVADIVQDASFSFHFNSAKLNKAPVIPDEVKNIFLTGATGFLGAYMLDCILEKTHANVFCLVKAENILDGLNRIKKNMDIYSLWKPYYSDRVKPVIGDLSKYQLGISDEIYAYLAKEIDLIYHPASHINFFYPYKFLKRTNVDGTIGILKLASQEKIKPVFYTSTIGVFESTKYTNDYVVGENEELPDPQGLFYGYSQSKWVAEKIIKAAGEKGLPVTIFMLGEILGDSRTGVCNIRDIYNYMVRSCVMSGAIPDLSVNLHAIPVDHAADTIINMSFISKTIGMQFNIVNPYPVSTIRVREFFASSGYDLSLVPFDIWVEMIESTAVEDVYMSSILPIVRNAVDQRNNKTYLEIQSELKLSYSYKNVEKFLYNYSMCCPALDGELFDKYMEYLENIEFIPKNDGKITKWS